MSQEVIQPKKKPKVDEKEGFVIQTKRKLYEGMAHMQKESWGVLKTYCNSVRKMTDKEKQSFKQRQISKLVSNKLYQIKLGD